MPSGVTEPAAPPRSLRRRSWREVELVSLDFETTGLDYGKDAIVSFGVVPVHEGRVRVGEAVHQLVVPAVPSSAISMRIHRILPQDLAGAPSIEEARDVLSRALHGRFVLAWFADVEIAFLSRVFEMRERTWAARTIDVREMALVLERDRDPDVRFSLSAVAGRYGVPVVSPHEALDDALVTAQLFLMLATKLEAAGSGSVRSLLRMTRS